MLITVEDNGVGFDKNQITEGIGLKNIKERIKAIDALISIDSEISKGVKTSIKINRSL